MLPKVASALLFLTLSVSASSAVSVTFLLSLFNPLHGSYALESCQWIILG